MTNSKAPWLTRGGAIALMAAAGIALAACSGGGGLNEDEAAGLQQELKEAQAQATADAAARMTAVAEAALAQTEKETAEAEAKVARTDQEAAETALRLAKATAAGQVSDAEADAETARKEAKDALDAKAKADDALIVAQDKQKAAEDERDAALADEKEAQDQLRLAQQATTDEAQRRRDAEQARERAEMEREEAEQLVNQAKAGDALEGFRSTTAAGTVSVSPKYAAVADVTATPAGGGTVNFASKSRSSSSGWTVSTLSNAGFTHNDGLVVYSNMGAPTRILLTQEYARFTDDMPDVANTPISAVISDADGRLIRSSSFPTGDGDDKPFPDNYDDPNVENAMLPGPDGNLGTDDDTVARYDTARISGSFHGASGHFHCAAAECTIGRRGDRYVIVDGPWTFHATDRARALVDDESYMYFGWWRREQRSDGSFSYAVFSGTDGGHLATSNGGTQFDALGSSATYRGPAVGQYSIYQPLGAQSGTGSFTAQAVLTADFDSNMLSGTVTSFSNDSSWSLALNRASMAGGDVGDDSGTVDWTIAGNTSSRQGDWDAVFFSEAPYVGQTPDGVVGEFDAIYDADVDEGDEVGRIVGAFGARK